MTYTTHPSFRAFTLLAVAFAMAAGCTKSKETKNGVDPDAYVSKADFVGKTFHLSRGIEDADSNNTVGATPGMSDDFGLVEARVTEKELQFVSTFDPRGRKGTMKIVASYPITAQFNIKRDTNDFGEETNKIVEDKTVAWDQRQYMRVDWANPSNTLSKFAAALSSKEADKNASGDDESDKPAAFTEENTSLLENPKIENGHISFLVETSVKKPGEKGTFILPMLETSAPAYRIVYRTHLMADKATDFQALPYSAQDFERFGFFFTQQNFDDPHGLLEKNMNLFANIHNVCEAGTARSCSTNKIRWVLSRDFPDKYKAVARKVVAEWNDTFKADLNRKDDVVFLDESAEADMSDPTQNVLAYFPSRTKSGLLGVAQWVADPRTGELVGVRATIYGDGIDYEVASVDDMISMIVSKDPLAQVLGTTAYGTVDGLVSPYNDKATALQFFENRKTLGFDKIKRSAFADTTLPLQLKTTQAHINDSPDKASIRMAQMAANAKDVFAIKELSILGKDAKQKDPSFPTTVAGVAIPNLGGLEQSLFVQAKFAADKAKLLSDAETGIHGTELVEEAAIRYLFNYLQTHTPEELDKNRQMVEDQIAQETFYTTALHEMGHTFGLRHNFEGSADKNHYAKEYYQIQDAIKNGSTQYVKEDLDPYASSSIMDYGRDFFSQKAGLGPYDRAAIKYAYNRSADRQADPQLNPDKPYLFCTDHMVDENILCRRFDKGANVSEITQANIDFYNHNFARMHYRRGRLTEGAQQGWGSPGLLINSLLTRVFLPTRLVMDEFLYSFIAFDKVANGEGYCSMKFIKASVDAHEIADVCSNEAMEATNVDPENFLATLVNALFVYDPNTGAMIGVRKKSSDYIPNGLADLLWANMQAQNFFTQVLGSPEPGQYIAVPGKSPTGAQSFQLVALDADQPTLEKKLQAFAAERGIEPTPEFMDQAGQLVADIRVDGYGRQLESKVSVQAGFTRTEALGAWWDKYAALIAISLQEVPVTKYRSASMNGNAYFYPQTKAFATQVFDHLITGNTAIMSIPVKLNMKDESGKPTVITVKAAAPAGINTDLKAIATFFSLSSLVSDTERSMVGKLEICDTNEAQCSSSPTGGPVAEYHSANSNHIYRAAQNSDGDSIAFDLISGAQKLAEQRADWNNKGDALGSVQADNIMAIAGSLGLRDQIVQEIGADTPLANFKDKDGNPVDLAGAVTGAWDNMKMLTDILKKTSQRFTALKIMDQTTSTFTAVKQLIGQRIEGQGDAGQCWVKDHPSAVTVPVSLAPAKPQPEITLSALFSVTAATAAASAPASVATTATNVPKPPGPKCGDETEGKVLANLLSLQADIATGNALVTKVMTADAEAIQAPIMVNRLTNMMESKENQILRIRQLIDSAGQRPN